MGSAEVKSVRGQCMCGAARFEVELKNTAAHACHCSMCRKWGSGPFIGVDCVTTPRFDDDQVIGRYSGSDWAERLFCKTCGSSLVWQTKSGEHVAIAAGLVDLGTDATLALEVFVDAKPDYYAFSGSSQKMTGSELFAAFAAGQEG